MKTLPFDSLAKLHGISYMALGMWAVVHRPSFESVLGRKTDYWLARTVGLLISATGATLLAAAQEEQAGRSIAVLGAAVPGMLIAIDLRYAVPGRIPRMYLLDALFHATFLVQWVPKLQQPSPK